MEEEYGEVIRDLAEENQTRKILEILNECSDMEEAKRKARELLKNER
ncbi:MAG: protein phosphatase [Lachnospiraceae bacterium]|nr:protein phosphatase [Lachnospiraceae bacterium]